MIKVNETIVEQGYFPDKTLLLKMNKGNFENYNNDIVDYTIKWNYENDAELFTIICIKKHLEPNKCWLTMSYCPHARMDRIKNNEDVFTLKYFADIINSLNFYGVSILDPHSNVAPALLNRCSVIQPYWDINTAIKRSKAEVVCFPDEGAMKRYSDMVNKPYAFCIKKRDWTTGKIQGLDLQNTECIVGKDVIIIDDICSKGGTFYYTAKALKEAGANNIYLYITHCENTILEGELLTSGLIERVYTTNSIFTKEHEKIEVFKL